MLIERAAYGNRWRQVSPAAKGSLAMAGLLAAYLARSPLNALAVASALALCTMLLAGVGPRVYLRVAAPAVGFLLLSCLTLLFPVTLDAAGRLSWQAAPQALPEIEATAARALAALAALLGLVLTTPLPDLIGLLRRLKMPEMLLDLMLLGYRTIFVFSTATRETLDAQQARLGYGTRRRSLHSLALLAANLALQVWRRSHALHQAVLARNGDGPLRFLTPSYPHARRDELLALLAGSGLIVAAGWIGA